MRFLVDAQLPPALARLLGDTGHIGEHVADAGLLDAGDEQIYRHASAVGAAIITKDEDFAVRKAFHRGSPAVVWLRVGNCSNRALLQWFRPLLPQIIDRLQQGEDLVEVV